MSIRFPATNAMTNAPNLRLTCPAGAFPVPTGDFIFCWFMRTGSLNIGQNYFYPFSAGAGGTTNGDVRFRTYRFNMDYQLTVTHGGQSLTYASAVDALLNGPHGRVYFFALTVCDAAGTPKMVLSVCEPGGTAVQNELTGGSVAAWLGSAGEICRYIGGKSSGSEGFYDGDLGDFAMIEGTVPHTAGIPTASVIEDIAAGVIDYETLADVTMTLGQRVTWYPMADARDFANAWAASPGASGAGPLTVQNVDADKGLILLNGNQLRDHGLVPDDTLDVMSQATWGSPGDPATAFADMPFRGGTYDDIKAGGTVAEVQARLVGEDGAMIRDWQACDMAPAGGTFTGGEFLAVPMQAGYMQVEFRARTAGGAVLRTATCGAARGVGASVVLIGQSSQTYVENGLVGETRPQEPLGLRASWVRIRPNPLADSHPQHRVQSHIAYYSDPSLTSTWAAGLRAILAEWHTAAPGVPISLITLSLGGIHLAAFASDAAHVGGYHTMGLPENAYRGQLGNMVSMLPWPTGRTNPYVYWKAGHGDAAAVVPQVWHDIHESLGKLIGSPAWTFLLPNIRKTSRPIPSNEVEKRGVYFAISQADPVTYRWGGNHDNTYVQADGTHPEAGPQGTPRIGAQAGKAFVMQSGAVADFFRHFISARYTDAGNTSVDLTIGLFVPASTQALWANGTDSAVWADGRGWAWAQPSA